MQVEGEVDLVQAGLGSAEPVAIGCLCSSPFSSKMPIGFLIIMGGLLCRLIIVHVALDRIFNQSYMFVPLDAPP